MEIKADTTVPVYVFGPDTDMSQDAQNRAFIRTIHSDEFTDGWLPRLHDRVTEGDDELLVIERTDTTATLLLLGGLPCSIEWCAGHDHIEARTWAGLNHQAEDRHMPLVGRFYERQLVATCMTLEKGRPALRIEVDLIATVSTRDVTKILQDLRRITAEVEAQAIAAGVL